MPKNHEVIRHSQNAKSNESIFELSFSDLSFIKDCCEKESKRFRCESFLENFLKICEETDLKELSTSQKQSFDTDI